MPPRSRYAVDPSLSVQSQSSYQQQPPSHYPSTPSQEPQLHSVSDRRSPLPSGPYAPQAPNQPTYTSQPSYHQSQQHAPPPQPRYGQVPPANHISAPPHSSGGSITGPRVRIDPSQMPNPIEAQEMDQNLWDDEDFMSCQTKGVIPLAGTDWRGVDQGLFEIFK